MREYYRAQALIFHKRAQEAWAERKRLRAERKFVEALKAECRAAEYRRERDLCKAKARAYK